MTAQRYQAIFDWFRARPAALRALGYAQKISVLGVYLVYGAVLAVTLWQRSGQFWRVLAVPAAVYVLGTLLRTAINRPRPYEALNFTPLFPKDTKGQSMPSRHCFSAAAIVAAAFTVWVPLGVAACLLAAVISILTMFAMMGGKNAQIMAEYQAAQDRMTKAGTEYVRGIPVVKMFQQTV